MDDQNQRVLLAFAMSFAVLMVWRFFFVKPLPPAPKPSPVAPAEKAPVSAVAPPSVPAQTPSAFPVQQGSEAREIVVEGDLYRVTLSSEGAVVRSWILKRYQDEKGDPLDVVNQAACDQLGYPMGLSLADQALSGKLNRGLYVVRTDPRLPTSGGGPGTWRAPVKLSFLYSDGRVEAEKEFSFGPNYEIHMQAGVRQGRLFLPLAVVWPGGFGDHSLPFKVKE